MVYSLFSGAAKQLCTAAALQDSVQESFEQSELQGRAFHRQGLHYTKILEGEHTSAHWRWAPAPGLPAPQSPCTSAQAGGISATPRPPGPAGSHQGPCSELHEDGRVKVAPISGARTPSCNMNQSSPRYQTQLKSGRSPTPSQKTSFTSINSRHSLRGVQLLAPDVRNPSGYHCLALATHLAEVCTQV